MDEDVPALFVSPGTRSVACELISDEPAVAAEADRVGRRGPPAAPELETLTRIVAAAGPAEAERERARGEARRG